MHPKDADGMTNSVDPDQTASLEAVWSWSALFAETYLSQYIEFIRYRGKYANDRISYSESTCVYSCMVFSNLVTWITTAHYASYFVLFWNSKWKIGKTPGLVGGCG